MSEPATEVSDSVLQKANKISEIFASLIESPKSAWNHSKESVVAQDDSPTKTQPRSQDAFYQRVSTFRPGLWTVHRITPLECASWGWKILEKDVLQCVTCQEVICATLPEIKDKVAYDKFFGVLKDRIETSHKKACGWLYNPCPKEFVEPLHVDTVEELRNMENSAQSLATLNSALPYLKNNRITAMLGADDEVINGLFKSDSASEDVKITSVLLVLSGWSKGQGAYLRCTVCRRQVGLWSFITIADEHKKTKAAATNPTTEYSRKRKLSSSNVEEENAQNERRITRQSPRKLKNNLENNAGDTPTAKRMRTRSKEDKKEEHIGEGMDIETDGCLLITSPSTQVEKVEKQYFSPLEEHRHWCPWVKIEHSTNDDHDDDAPKGFCVVTEQVRAMLQMSNTQKSDARDKYVENVEGLRMIRSLLGEISQDAGVSSLITSCD